MKRTFIALLNLPIVVLPLVFAITTATDPLVGPGLRAMTREADCKRKATVSGSEIHCHEEGTNCVITCPAES